MTSTSVWFEVAHSRVVARAAMYACAGRATDARREHPLSTTPSGATARRVDSARPAAQRHGESPRRRRPYAANVAPENAPQKLDYKPRPAPFWNPIGHLAWSHIASLPTPFRCENGRLAPGFRNGSFTVLSPTLGRSAPEYPRTYAQFRVRKRAPVIDRIRREAYPRITHEEPAL